MDNRQRTNTTLTFGKPDRVPLAPGHGRKSTRERWIAEGMDPATKDPARLAFQLVGGTPEAERPNHDFFVDERMIPRFEEAVLERKERTLIVRDWKGNVCEISDEFTPEYLRNAMDFVTRRWIKCPVENRADWEDMKRRYNAADAARFPTDAIARGAALKERDYFIEFNLSGPFWQLREWLGFERLCELFYDDPAWLKEMIDFWSDHVAALIKKTIALCGPDSIHISEDMAYKAHPMISPAMTREFLYPAWRRWADLVRPACPIYSMDSDGYIGDLIPIWIDAGFNACDPIEVAAHNDINDFRRQFGRNMAYRGGVDKRSMAAGGIILEAEIARIKPVIQDGGFIPSCDHGIPSDVSWPNFLRYVELLAKETGWL